MPLSWITSRTAGACLHSKSTLPVRDIKQSSRLKLGSTARRRAFSRNIVTSTHQLSILKAVNAILRLCDVATHCLACRHSLQSKQTCETAINLSTRLLTIAVSLYNMKRVESSPELSICSSNSLRTALVSGAMHLGAITIEHYEIEPKPWVQLANRVLLNGSNSIFPRTSVLSALFGGMISAAKQYETAHRDTKAAEGAICLLSTLQVVFETGMTKEGDSRIANVQTTVKTQKGDHAQLNAAPATNSAPVSQAARSFLVERVISAEEEGDEARIAAQTVNQACEEYAERAGEEGGMVGLFLRVFAASAKHCKQESVDEAVFSLSEGTLPCPPDESDTSSEVRQRGFEGQAVYVSDQRSKDLYSTTVDVFDQRTKDGLRSGHTSSTGEIGVQQAERIEIHRAIGAIALDALSHWVERTENLTRNGKRDFLEFCSDICRSASMFTLGSSSSSYDLKVSMGDFGSLIGPKQHIEKHPVSERSVKWDSVIQDLVASCNRVTPIFTSIVTSDQGLDVVNPILSVFLQRGEEADIFSERGVDESQRMPTENVLHTLLSVTTAYTAFAIIERVLNHLKGVVAGADSPSSLGHVAASLSLISYSTATLLSTEAHQRCTRSALSSLYHRDLDSNIDPIFPEIAPERDIASSAMDSESVSGNIQNRLSATLQECVTVIGSLFRKCNASVEKRVHSLVSSPQEVQVSEFVATSITRKIERFRYHLFWSCLNLLYWTFTYGSRSKWCHQEFAGGG